MRVKLQIFMILNLNQIISNSKLILKFPAFKTIEKFAILKTKAKMENLVTISYFSSYSVLE